MKFATHLFIVIGLPHPGRLWAISYYRRDEDSSKQTFFTNGLRPEEPITEKELEMLVTSKKAIKLPKEIPIPDGDTLFVGANARLWLADIEKPFLRREQIGWYYTKKGTVVVF